MANDNKNIRRNPLVRDEAESLHNIPTLDDGERASGGRKFQRSSPGQMSSIGGLALFLLSCLIIGSISFTLLVLVSFLHAMGVF